MSEVYAAANPYASYGSIITGTAFVGRSSAIRSIRSRVFTSFDAACVSIIGPPRVGKSSLAQHVLDTFATGTSARGLTFLPVWITISGAKSEQSLFRELAYQTQVWLTEQEEPDDRAQARLKPLYSALVESVTWDDMRMRLKTYLRQLRRSRYQVVAVLDEFDAARYVFEDSDPFEFLRSIASDGEIRVALITVSRRPLPEIVVPSAPDLSNFPQIFGMPERLSSFGDSELRELIARSPYTDDRLRKALFTWLAQETRGQPFLASALLSVLHEHWAAAGPPASPKAVKKQFTDAFTACGQLIAEYHDKMVDLLREDGMLSKLLELVFGSQMTIRIQDAERIAREGIIRKTDGGWAAYSPSFREYLGLL